MELAELVGLSREDQYQLADSLEDFERRRAKLEHSLDAARMDAVHSQSDYEVFAEQAKAADSKIQFASQRKVKLGLALALTLLMAFAGSFVLYSSPDHGGVSYLIAGVALIAFALVIGAAGVSMALKPIPGEDELDEELKKRDWVVQQDKKTVEACERSLRDFDAQVVSFLEANGLKAAAGSLRRARRLLDQLDDYRTSCATENLNHQARSLQCASIRKELAECKNQRVELCRKAGFDDGASLEAISQAIERQRAGPC